MHLACLDQLNLHVPFHWKLIDFHLPCGLPKPSAEPQLVSTASAGRHSLAPLASGPVQPARQEDHLQVQFFGF
jgi:hypothetical protein